LVYGSKRFFPFTAIGWDADGHSSRLTGASEPEEPECPPDNIIVSTLKFIISLFLPLALPLLRFFLPDLANSLEAAMNTAVVVKRDVVDAGLQTAKEVAVVGEKVSKIATEIPGAFTNAAAKAQDKIAAASAAASAAATATTRTMVGGARAPRSEITPMDTFAALGITAVLGGGFILNAIRNAKLTGINDSPPIPGSI
jgi:hypothetical protein